MNETADAVDFAPGDGICETANGNGICTLRAAFQETNSLPGPDTIIVPAGTYTLTLPGIDGTAAAGDLDIIDDLTVIGADEDQTIIDGNRLDRVIHVLCPGSCSTSITVNLSNLTVQNGLTLASPAGAGIFNSAGVLIMDHMTVRENEGNYGTGGQSGAGIANYGTLTMTNSLVISNTAISGLNRGGGLGLGVIESLDIDSKTYIGSSQILGNSGDGITVHCCAGAGADLTIEQSVVSNNSGYGISHDGNELIIRDNEIANNQNGGVGAFQASHGINLSIEIDRSTIRDNSGNGGIVITDGELEVSNSTVSNNTGTAERGGLFIGSGITSVSIINSTIVQNTSGTGGGLFVNSQDIEDITITNTIIAENTGQNCSDVMTGYSGGHNLEDGTDCNFTAVGDLQNTDPMLGPLQNNGGSTSTHALMPNSPAADAGDDAICQSDPINSLDQRRYTRHDQDGNNDGGTDSNPCDIGAYEISVPPTFVYLPAVLKSD